MPLLEWMVQRFPSRDREYWSRAIEDGRVRVMEPRDVETAKRADKAEALKMSRSCTSMEPVLPGMVIITEVRRETEPEVHGQIRILSQEDGYLVVNKPASWPVHPGGRFYNNTLWYQLKKQYPTLTLMHRLDRETSGCMVVSLTQEATRFWNGLFRGGGLEKDYLVLVEGGRQALTAALGSHRGIIECTGRLYRDESSPIAKKRLFIPETDGSPEGEPCSTLIEPLECGREISLLRARLVTGKTHQIRSTLSSLGLPVVGDKLYGRDPHWYTRWIQRTLTPRDIQEMRTDYQALHSWRMGFRDQLGQSREFIAPVPEHMQELMRNQGISW